MALYDTNVCVCCVLRATGHLPNASLEQLYISPAPRPRPLRLFGEVLGFVAIAFRLE